MVAAGVGEGRRAGQRFGQPAEDAVQRPIRVAAVLHQGAAGQGDDAGAAEGGLGQHVRQLGQSALPRRGVGRLQFGQHPLGGGVGVLDRVAIGGGGRGQVGGGLLEMIHPGSSPRGARAWVLLL